MTRHLPPVALTIAGSDSGGGAGIQADLKTFAAFDCHGTTALTAVTAQNTRGVRAAVLLETDLIAQQIAAVADDLPPAATKTGMLGSAAIIETVAAAVEHHRLAPLVVDPVMIAKSGDPLIDEAAVEALREKLLPLASVTTPNRYEAARLLDRDKPIADLQTAAEAARAICDRYGTPACVVKGIRRDNEAVDVCYDGGALHEFVAPYHADAAVHGSGCAYAAAIAAGLAQDQPLHHAIQTAKQFIDTAIQRAPRLGAGTPPVDPTAWHTANLEPNP